MMSGFAVWLSRCRRGMLLHMVTELDGARKTGWVPDLDTFGTRLALIRQRMGWNIAEAERACGVGRGSWTLWEQGREPSRYMTVCVAIATRTGCDLDWLVYGPSKPGRELNVEYPLRRDPLAARIVKPVVANGEISHGDGRRRRTASGPRASGNRPTGLDRKVSTANHTAMISRGSVA